MANSLARPVIRPDDQRLKHGAAPRSGSTREYRIWRNMLNRCTNPNNPAWSDYGGRGITVCERWKRFINFRADMGLCPSGCSLDRKDNSRGYEPDNCRWATRREQANNTRKTRLISFDGVTASVAEWARRMGITRKTLSARLNDHGWSVEKALTTGVRFGTH